MPTIYFFGLEVFGSVDHDPGQPYPSYSCGGVPPSTDVEVEEILLDDPEEFLLTDVISEIGNERGWSDSLVEMVCAFHRITGRFLPVVERYVWDRWRDDIEDALIDAHQESAYD